MDRSTQKLTTGRIHYSMFDVGRSMFISFFFDLTGRSRPAATLVRNFMKSDAISKKYLTAERAEIAEII
jgi:hypothetical protein